MSRKRIVDPGLGVNLSLIITPMLDMAFQLMAFFIMTYQPPTDEKNLAGRLLPAMKEEQKAKMAPTKGKKKAEKDAPPPDTKLPEDKIPEDAILDDNKDVPKDTVRVIVEVAGNPNAPDKNAGEPGRILVQKLPGDTKPVLLVDINESFEKGMTRLGKKLLEFREGVAGENSKLQLEVHPDLRYVYFIRVQDVCRAAHYKEMGFTKPVRGDQEKDKDKKKG